MENDRPKYFVYLPIICTLIFAGGILIGSFFFGNKALNNSQQNSYQGSIYREILYHIKNSYVDPVNVDSLRDYGIEKMLEKLDPHTVYIPASEAQIAAADLQDGFDGIGVEFNIFNDSLFVVAAVGGGPSEAVGIQSGDIILKADNTELVGKKLNSNLVVKSLRGKKGTIVKLSVLRKSQKKLLTFTVRRDKIPTYTVDAAFMMSDKKTGYIKITRFGETTFEEFKTHLASLKKSGMQKLILDLRDNPGGYLDQATNILDELIPGKEILVYTKGVQSSKNYEISAGKEGIFEKEPIVVLVDEGSASASEIVSGALQDYDRAKIIGRRTFGKGLVQEPIQLSDGSELRLTVSRYYIPSGRSIQKPYEKGKINDYMEDMHNRQKSKELYQQDSISQKGRPKFKTKAGRIVYGGGGITPDVFIAQDTSYYSILLFELFNNGAFREFASTYGTQNASSIKPKGIDAFILDKNLENKILLEFKEHIRTKIKGYKESDFQRSKTFIGSNLMALIARYVWKENEKTGLSNEYYKVLMHSDSYLKAALK
ncbi:MAG: S41 family peptidase [Leadbetterella sp.]